MVLTLVILVIVVAVLWLGSHFVIGITLIKSDEVGLVEKRFSHKGSLDKAIIALNGEAGYQPDVLRGGIHLRSRIQYRIHRAPLVTIPQGQIGYVFARDGQPLRPEQTLGKVVQGNSFEDVRFFIEKGGQRGPQRAILREGTYALNLIQFVVLSEQRLYFMALDGNDRDIIERMGAALDKIQGFRPVVIGGGSNDLVQLSDAQRKTDRWAGEDSPEGADEPKRSESERQGDVVGIVTVHDGPSLPQNEIIAPLVGTDPKSETFHNNFQDPEKFLAAGGLRGKQYQVLTDGTYFVNRLFATVEFVPKTVIEIGWTGVVVSFFGEKGEDASGDEFRHGELVEAGKKGVWQEPLMPGKYAFNTYAGRVEKVPVTNFVLKWITNEAGPHGFDQNLSEIGLITKDAFEPTLPLSVVIQIPYREAPLVIQRFGNIQRLVEQTLDPMVGSYFKNVGQRMTLIELIQRRSDIQDQSTEQMREKFARYNLRLEEVLIGTPHASDTDQKIEQILSQSARPPDRRRAGHHLRPPAEGGRKRERPERGAGDRRPADAAHPVGHSDRHHRERRQGRGREGHPGGPEDHHPGDRRRPQDPGHRRGPGRGRGQDRPGQGDRRERAGQGLRRPRLPGRARRHGARRRGHPGVGRADRAQHGDQHGRRRRPRRHERLLQPPGSAHDPDNQREAGRRLQRSRGEPRAAGRHRRHQGPAPREAGRRPVSPPAVVAAPIDDAAAALKAALDASTAATADAGSPTGEAAAPATASVTAPVATGAVTSAAGAALDVTIAAATQAQPAAVDEVKSSTTGGDQPHGDGVDRWLAQNQAAMPGAPKAKKRPRKPAGPAGD